MTLIDALVASFIGIATVLLAVLWRRGPEKRRAFFMAGMLMAGATILLAVVADELEHAVADHDPSAPRVVDLPARSAGAAGLSLTLPGTWTLDRPDPEDHFWLHPDPDGELRWEHLVAARQDLNTCHLLDATAYAAALGLDALESVVAHEVAGLEGERDEALPARFTRPLSAIRDAGVTTGCLDLPAGRGAWFDIENWAGYARRHYVIEAGGRVLILTCRALVTEGAPTDRWLSIARAIRPDEDLARQD